MDRTVALGAIEQARRAATERLDFSAGSGPLCAVSPDATGSRDAKYHEGSVAALSELRKLVRRDRSATHVPVNVVQGVHEEWLSRRDDHSSAAWAAYYEGGAHAIAALLNDAARPQHGEPETAADDTP